MKKINIYLYDCIVVHKVWLHICNVNWLVNIFENTEYEFNKLSLDTALGSNEYGVIMDSL